MPSPNAIVAMVIRIDPGVEKLRGAELFRKYPDGFTIVFEGDQTARLYPGDRAADRLEILEELRQMRRTVRGHAPPSKPTRNHEYERGKMKPAVEYKP